MGVQFAGNILVQSNGGPLPISQGGTGEISAALAINALVPAQTGNTGKVLTTNGSVVSWQTGGGGGGAGGNLGQAGGAGNTVIVDVIPAGGPGGAPGASVFGSANITWVTIGTILGPMS